MMLFRSPQGNDQQCYQQRQAKYKRYKKNPEVSPKSGDIKQDVVVKWDYPIHLGPRSCPSLHDRLKDEHPHDHGNGCRRSKDEWSYVLHLRFNVAAI